ncbi:MAG: hypothetical protein U9R75_02280, partial [Candidatus Thermoplasmatota archaeon]|nr:hypothetical protein [Candidatus Thermoplasmatota archaeon]
MVHMHRTHILPSSILFHSIGSIGRKHIGLSRITKEDYKRLFPASNWRGERSTEHNVLVNFFMVLGIITSHHNDIYGL